jgi:hypothetical protein
MTALRDASRGTRAAWAGLVVAVAIAISIWLNGYQQTHSVNIEFAGTGTYQSHPAWADTLAAVVVVAGMGIAAAIILAPRLFKPPASDANGSDQ